MQKPPKLAPNLIKWADFDETEWLEEIREMHFAKARYNKQFKELFERLPFDSLEIFYDYDNYFITPEALWNILNKHFLHDGTITQRRFTVSLFDLLQILLDGKFMAPQPLVNKKLLLRKVFDPHKAIGKKKDGTDTSTTSIITNLNGQIMTAFPATSKSFAPLNPSQIKDDEILTGISPEQLGPEDNLGRHRFYKAFFVKVIGEK